MYRENCFLFYKLITCKTILFLALSPLFAKTETLPSALDAQIMQEDPCALLGSSFLKNTDNYTAHLYMGKCAFSKKDIDAAMAAYDRAEILNSKSCLTHKLIADLHATIGNFDIAKKEYAKAHSLCKTPIIPLPMFNKEPHSLSFSLELSRGIDDNVKQIATLSELNQWFNTNSYPLEPQSDYFTKADMQFIHNYEHDLNSHVSYQSLFYFQNTEYDQIKDSNLLYAMLQTGPLLSYKKLNLWLPISYTHVALGSLAYSEHVALHPQFYKKLPANMLLTFFAGIEYTKYLQWDQGDHIQYSAKLSVKKSYDKDYWQLGYHYLNERKIDPSSLLSFIDNQYHELHVNYEKEFYQHLALNMGLAYRLVYYEDLINTSLGERYDILLQTRLSLFYEINEKAGLSFSYYFYDNRTNYVPTRYRKDLFYCGLKFSI